MTDEAPAPAARPSPVTLCGVTLEQYAGITAALADEFPLDTLLANDGIALADWSRAELAWKKRLAVDGLEGPLFTEFRARRSEAEDWLERKVTPLDTDLGAWLSFLHAWSTHAAPFELLADAGLRMSDVARLQRRWARRMVEEPAVQKRAAEIARKGAGPLPPIHAAVAELTPFPWSRGGATSPAKPAKAAAPAARDLAAKAPALPPLPSPPPPVAPSPPVATSPLATTSPLLDAPRSPVLPFVDGVAAPEVAIGSSTEVASPRARPDVYETAPVVVVPRGPALPFVNDAAPATEKLPTPAPHPFATTSPVDVVPRGPALPFSRDAAPALTMASAPEPPPPPPKNPLADTSPTVDVPRGPALPFAGPLKPEGPEPPRKRNPLAELSFDVKVPDHLRSLPLKQAPPASPAAPPRPFQPSLTLEQHASLCVELAVQPDRSAETLSRYRVTPMQKALTDRHYRERFAREAGLRARWDAAYRAYREWYIGTLQRKL